MAVLTQAQRDGLSNSQYALSGRRFPINDEKHAKAAIMLSNKGTDAEEAETVRRKARAYLKNHAQGGKIFNYMNGGRTMPSGPYNNMQYKTSFKNGGMNKGPYNNMNYNANFAAGGPQTEENPKFYDKATQEYYPGPDWIPGGKIGDPETTEVTEEVTETVTPSWQEKSRANIAAGKKKRDDAYWGGDEGEMIMQRGLKQGTSDWQAKIRSLQGQGTPVGKDLNWAESTLEGDSITQPVIPGYDSGPRRGINDATLLDRYTESTGRKGTGTAGSSGGGYLNEKGGLDPDTKKMMFDEVQTNYGLEGVMKRGKKKLTEVGESIWDYVTD